MTRIRFCHLGRAWPSHSDEGTKANPKYFCQSKASVERIVEGMRRATRRHFPAEDKISIVLEGLRSIDCIAEPRRKEGIAQSHYHTQPKAFVGAGKRRLAGDVAGAATGGEAQDQIGRPPASYRSDCSVSGTEFVHGGQVGDRLQDSGW
jgi:transposase